MLCRDAWHELGDKSSKECMLEYINKLLEVDEDWEQKVFVIIFRNNIYFAPHFYYLTHMHCILKCFMDFFHNCCVEKIIFICQAVTLDCSTTTLVFSLHYWNLYLRGIFCLKICLQTIIQMLLIVILSKSVKFSNHLSTGHIYLQNLKNWSLQLNAT